MTSCSLTHRHTHAHIHARTYRQSDSACSSRMILITEQWTISSITIVCLLWLKQRNRSRFFPSVFCSNKTFYEYMIYQNNLTPKGLLSEALPFDFRFLYLWLCFPPVDVLFKASPVGFSNCTSKHKNLMTLNLNLPAHAAHSSKLIDQCHGK